MNETSQQSNIQPILPGSTIGILGGGQLGRMMVLAGKAMGYRFVVLDPAEDSPCGQVADRQIVARYDDVEAARELASLSQAITYEFENVDASVASLLEQESYVPQGSRLLFTTQHRLREKRALQAAGIQTAAYAAIDHPRWILAEAERLGYPCILKTVTGGYDGKGQWIIRQKRDAENITYELGDLTSPEGSSGEWILEKFVPFTKELSVIAARSPQGEVRTFPVAENIHANNILHLSIVPARIPREIAEKAEQMAERIAKALQVVGLIAVEMFLTADGNLLVNELAPRPHNSGHYTMDACVTSQFEQHIRAICNLPLGSTRLLTPVVMVNILGEHLDPVLKRMTGKDPLEESGEVKVNVHLYGKKEVRKGRKMGHLNVTSPSVDKALEWIGKTGIWKTASPIGSAAGR